MALSFHFTFSLYFSLLPSVCTFPPTLSLLSNSNFTLFSPLSHSISLSIFLLLPLSTFSFYFPLHFLSIFYILALLSNFISSIFSLHFLTIILSLSSHSTFTVYILISFLFFHFLTLFLSHLSFSSIFSL